jgi:hypothetical protein
MSDKFQFSVTTNYRVLAGYLPPTGTPIEPNQQFGWLKLDLLGVDEAQINFNMATEVAFDGVPLTEFRAMFDDVKALIVAFENLLGV